MMETVEKSMGMKREDVEGTTEGTVYAKRQKPQHAQQKQDSYIPELKAGKR